MRLPGHSDTVLTDRLPPEVQAYIARFGPNKINRLLALNAANIIAATPEQTGVMLNISPVTLLAWRKKGIGPRFARIHGRVRYPVEELKRWVMDQLADPAFDLAERKTDPGYSRRAARMANAANRRRTAVA